MRSHRVVPKTRPWKHRWAACSVRSSRCDRDLPVSQVDDFDRTMFQIVEGEIDRTRNMDIVDILWLTSNPFRALCNSGSTQPQMRTPQLRSSKPSSVEVELSPTDRDFPVRKIAFRVLPIQGARKRSGQAVLLIAWPSSHRPQYRRRPLQCAERSLRCRGSRRAGMWR